MKRAVHHLAPHFLPTSLSPSPADDFNSLKISQTIRTTLIVSESYSTDTSDVVLALQANTTSKRNCERLLGSLEKNGNILSGIFVLDSSSCKSSSNTWWIILASVLGAAILTVIVIVLVFTLVPSARLMLRPFLARDALMKEESRSKLPAASGASPVSTSQMGGFL